MGNKYFMGRKKIINIFFIGTTPKLVLIMWCICAGTLSIFMEMLVNTQSFKRGGISK